MRLPRVASHWAVVLMIASNVFICIHSFTCDLIPSFRVNCFLQMRACVNFPFLVSLSINWLVKAPFIQLNSKLIARSSPSRISSNFTIFTWSVSRWVRRKILFTSTCARLIIIRVWTLSAWPLLVLDPLLFHFFSYTSPHGTWNLPFSFKRPKSCRNNNNDDSAFSFLVSLFFLLLESLS